MRPMVIPTSMWNTLHIIYRRDKKFTKILDNQTLTGYIINAQQKGENMSKKQKTYKGRPVKESYQTDEQGWSGDDAYHKVSDGKGGYKYVSDYELD